MRSALTLICLLWCVNLSAHCLSLPASAEPVTLAYVYDGDTLVLKDGRKIRLLNINTPELGRSGGADEAFAVQAKQAANHWLVARASLFLVVDEERKDRYGRWLAHVLDAQHNSLAEHLLALGLADAIVVPPNVAAADCYFAMADQARRAGRGFWQARTPSSAEVITHSGFQLVHGLITHSTKSRNGDWWLELQGQLAVHIRAQDLIYFPDGVSRFGVGTQVEISGWVVHRSQSDAVRLKGYTPWKVQVRTAHAIRVVL